MSEQNNMQNSASNAMDAEIREKVLAWLRDVFGNGRYRLGNRGSGPTSRDYYLEITNNTNVDLRELRMQVEIYKDQIRVDTVTAKTGVSGIKAGETGQLNFFTSQTGFSGLKVLPETVTYKADWVSEQAILTRPKKKGLFGRKKKNISEAFRVGTGDQLKTKRNEYVQKLDDLKRQTQDEEIRQGLERLIPIVENIFRRVAEVPGSEQEIKRLTDRYLPMIINSTESYLSYAKRQISGEEMEDLKAEVISGIKLVAEACGNLLNRLYEDGIVDASTDISVLKMLLQQDGLLNAEFERQQTGDDKTGGTEND